MNHLVRLFPFLVIAGLVVLSGPVAAEETAAAEDTTVVSPSSADQRNPGIKSGTTALLWSLIGTAVPVVTGTLGLYRNDESSTLTGVVLVGGLIIGPALGHFYSSRPAPGLIGIGIRTAAMAAVGAGVVAALDDDNATDLTVLGASGAIVGTASLIWDIASAPRSADAHNKQVQRGHAALRIAPSIGSKGLGLRAAVSF